MRYGIVVHLWLICMRFKCLFVLWQIYLCFYGFVCIFKKNYCWIVLWNEKKQNIDIRISNMQGNGFELIIIYFLTEKFVDIIACIGLCGIKIDYGRNWNQSQRIEERMKTEISSLLYLSLEFEKAVRHGIRKPGIVAWPCESPSGSRLDVFCLHSRFSPNTFK